MVTPPPIAVALGGRVFGSALEGLGLLVVIVIVIVVLERLGDTLKRRKNRRAYFRTWGRLPDAEEPVVRSFGDDLWGTAKVVGLFLALSLAAGVSMSDAGLAEGIRSGMWVAVIVLGFVVTLMALWTLVVLLAWLLLLRSRE